MSIELIHERYSSEQLHAVVDRVLGVTMLCSMATTDEDGAPHINTAFFCHDENLVLYFLSHPDSQHARNIRRSGRLAVDVYDARQPWGAAHVGLQLYGRAEEATGAAADAARAGYATRFPLYVDFVEGRPGVGGPTRAASFFDLRFYVFRSDSVKILAEPEFGDEVLVVATLANAR